MNKSDRTNGSRIWLRLIVGTLCASVLSFALVGCQLFGDEPTPQNPQPSSEDAPQTASERMIGSAAAPDIPDELEIEGGVPMLTVYDTKNQSYEEMDIEQYVMGVLAGEMRNDWPIEALKAQAILARTFVLKFIDEKDSMYKGADISTDIKEAQAYDASQINERIERAVNETRGEVLSADGELPYAWFHAHAGGKTELPTAALDYDKESPSYTQVVDSPDSDMAPTSVKNWTATFSVDEVEDAAEDSGVDVDDIYSIELGDKGESGRTINFLINGKKVSAPSLRINLDSKKLKSTLISSVSMEGDKITFTGSGYGHGVGMSQWGAYGMAEEGKSAEEIITHYFQNVGISKLW